MALWGISGVMVLSGCGGSGTTPVSVDYAPELSAQYGLSLIGAGTINDAGYTGSGIKVAVVDSGIDSSHLEFSGRTIYGTDFGGSTNGYAGDDNGHGTHVASIIGANKDAVGIRGVAYDATLYSYRVANDSGTLSGLNSDSKKATVFNQHVTDNIRVSNNSWGSSATATSYSEATLRWLYPNTISALRSAQQNGTVFVFSAGNDGKNNAQLIGGLPYRITELANEWLTVVAVGSNLQETDYTSRCGVAADFCVTAPGGGDDQSADGIYAAQANGTYVRYSGTSMAAPHVSGVVATTMQQFPSLTAAQIVTRVKDTATYVGLKGNIIGCTVSTCTTAQMETIFGHGLVSSAASTSMISSAGYSIDGKVYSGNNLNVSAKKLYVVSGLSTSTREAIGRATTAVFDSFDGATFNVSARKVFDTSSHPKLSIIGYNMNGIQNASLGSKYSFYAIDNVKSSDFDFYITSSSDPVSLGASSLWKDKAGLMPQPSFGVTKPTHQLEIGMYNDKVFSFRPFTQYTKTDEIILDGYGINVSLEPFQDVAFYGTFSSGTGAFNLGATTSNQVFRKKFKSFEIGLNAALSETKRFIFRSSSNTLENSEGGVHSWGVRDAVFSQAVAGFEFQIGKPKLTFGGYLPSELTSGNVNILMPAGRNNAGQVSYNNQSIKIQREPKFGAFITASIPLLSKDRYSGDLNLALQQSPYEHDKVGTGSFALMLKF
ncbi:MAG: subtilisin family serine protease [Paracoccaceae bacterium]|jgi:subtilisin family serine protease